MQQLLHDAASNLTKWWPLQLALPAPSRLRSGQVTVPYGLPRACAAVLRLVVSPAD